MCREQPLQSGFWEGMLSHVPNVGTGLGPREQLRELPTEAKRRASQPVGLHLPEPSSSSFLPRDQDEPQAHLREPLWKHLACL